MIPTIDDFTDKFGFNDGASSEPRDFIVRDLLVDRFNAESTKYVAVAYDRDGFHNGCMIVFFERIADWSGKDYLQAWGRRDTSPVSCTAASPDEWDWEDHIRDLYSVGAYTRP